MAQSKKHIQDILTRNTDCISSLVFSAAFLTSQQHKDKSRQTKYTGQLSTFTNTGKQ